MSLEFLKEILRLPVLDENVADSEYRTDNDRMSYIGFDKTPVFLNFFHSFKIVTILAIISFVFFIIWFVYKIWKRVMNFVLAKFCWFFFMKIHQIILIEMFLFLSINTLMELYNPTKQAGYTFFAVCCLLLITTYFFFFHIHLLFNLYCFWT